MRKILSLQENLENEIVISWFGFFSSIYDYIDQNFSGSWIVDAHLGNCYKIAKNQFPSLIVIFQKNNFEIPEILNQIALQYTNHAISPLKNTIKPRDYQIKMSTILYNDCRKLLALDTGLGKSVTALLGCRNIEGTILIVAPTSIIHFWKSETLNIYPDAEVIIWDTFEKSSKYNPKYLIISYDKLKSKNTYKQLLDYYPITGLVLDEAHYIRAITPSGAPASQRAIACLYIAARVKYCYLLTATPIMSHTKDIYNLLIALKADNITHNSFWEFAKRYCNLQLKRIGNKSFWDINGSSNQDELYHLLKPYMIRMLKECELKDIMINRQIIPLEITTTTNMLPKKDNFIRELMKARREIAIAKAYYTIKFAQDLIDSGKKVIVFSSFLDSIQLIAKAFKSSVTICGNQTSEERNHMVQEFQNGTSEICVISTAAGSTGLTLTQSDTMIFNDIELVPSIIRQSEGRIIRLTQQKKLVNIYFMLAQNSIVDRYIFDLIDVKSITINKVIDHKDITNELFKKIIKDNILT